MRSMKSTITLLLLPLARAQRADDWLLETPAETATVVEGSLGGVPTLTLQNGLASRVFAFLPAPPPPAGPPPAPPGPCPTWCTGCSDDSGDSPSPDPAKVCCANPGGRQVHGPNKGEVYPYFGKPCGEQSDCGQCTLDNACICTKIGSASNASCCMPRESHQMSNVTGFATVALSREGHAGREHDCGAQLLRASSPEAFITLDGVEYGVGGLVGQSDYAFLNTSLLHTWGADPSAFVYKQHRTGLPQKRYEWSPGVRHSDSTLAWPPRGITLEIDFVAPAHAPLAHQAVTVTVVYAMYDGLPLYEKHVMISVNAGKTAQVRVDALTTDLLYVTNEAMGYWGQPRYGALTAASNSGRVHMESEMSRGGATTQLLGDSRCTTCTQGASGDLVLNSSYPLGPAAEIGRLPTGFHGTNFSSFHTFVLLQDSDDSERQGLAIRKMYRILAPGVTENPIFMHLTDTSPAGVRKAVDQCAEVGFEMYECWF